MFDSSVINWFFQSQVRVVFTRTRKMRAAAAAELSTCRRIASSSHTTPATSRLSLTSTLHERLVQIPNLLLHPKVKTKNVWILPDTPARFRPVDSSFSKKSIGGVHWCLLSVQLLGLSSYLRDQVSLKTSFFESQRDALAPAHPSSSQ